MNKRDITDRMCPMDCGHEAMNCGYENALDVQQTGTKIVGILQSY